MPVWAQRFARIAESIFRAVVIALAVYGGLDLVRAAVADDPSTAYLPAVAKAEEVQSLEERVTALEDLLAHVSRDGDDIYVTGANLHVVNGTGATDGITNGLGNVIIGYNETRTARQESNDRGGSHMLVVGSHNNYTSFGGIVAGFGNAARGPFAAVTGGSVNEATGVCAVVSAGKANIASGVYASVSGGDFNEARGAYSSISGGVANTATGENASVSGGSGNESSGYYSSVSGGEDNRATGASASVSGGRKRQATGDYNWRAGELLQEN